MLNPAHYYGLQDLGGIAPGKVADLLLVTDLCGVHISTVIKDGIVVAKDGKLIEEPVRYRYPDKAYHTFALEGVLEDDLYISVEGTKALVRVVDIVNDTITGEMQAQLFVHKGNLSPLPEHDIIKT